MRQVLLLSAVTLAFAQQAGQITATFGGISRSWPYTLRPKTILTSFDCGTQSLLEPGDILTCTVSLNQVARTDSLVTIPNMGNVLSGPPTVTIPKGQISASVNITVIDTTTINPAAVTVTAPGQQPQFIAPVR